MTPDEPLIAAADTRLHNSGWGRPPEQHRLPPIGITLRLDIASILRAWPGITLALLAKVASASVTQRPYTRGLVAQYASALLEALTRTTAEASTDPLVALRRLRDHVVASDWTTGICLAVVPETVASPLDRPSVALSTTEVALALVALAFAHPPTVIWRAEPSLNLLHPRSRLNVNMLRAESAHPRARELWSGLREHLVGR